MVLDIDYVALGFLIYQILKYNLHAQVEQMQSYQG